jgi:hypothetical protein
MAKIITSEDFNTLTLDEKANIVWKHGVFLNEAVEYGKFRISLYELFNFFVGIYYDVHKNDIQKIEILKINFKETLLKKISPN